ncbi:hypothetical protein [Microbulbifer aggregans]|uniref:hypothetical protein n=1 Tax=Microbulbifer aggregans TaxID=1769779 RepID=UPI001CFDD6A5|nr:hypothetical protein [Microbulbifer aggregans]
MQLLKGLVATILFAASSSLMAKECVISTTPRALFTGVEGVVREHFEPEKGEYSATLKDGSSVTARFDLCGLGVKASYLIEHESGRLSEYIKVLLVSAIPSEDTARTISSQVVKYSEEDFRRGITLQEANGGHRVQVKDSPSPLYETVIHYRWVPPEH